MTDYRRIRENLEIIISESLELIDYLEPESETKISCWGCGARCSCPNPKPLQAMLKEPEALTISKDDMKGEFDVKIRTDNIVPAGCGCFESKSGTVEMFCPKHEDKECESNDVLIANGTEPKAKYITVHKGLIDTPTPPSKQPTMPAGVKRKMKQKLMSKEQYEAIQYLKSLLSKLDTAVEALTGIATINSGPTPVEAYQEMRNIARQAIKLIEED